MSGNNPYCDTLNAPDFYQRLCQSDEQRWEVLLRYTQAEVRYRLRHHTTNRDDLVAEHTSSAIEQIIKHLAAFRHDGPFSAWVDMIIRRTLIHPDQRGTIQAIGRFLASAKRLPAPQAGQLQAIIDHQPDAERALLLAVLHGTWSGRFDDQATQKTWYRARQVLLNDAEFVHLLGALGPTFRQAATLAAWYTTWKQAPLSFSHIDLRGEPGLFDPPDPGPEPLEALVAKEAHSFLLMCLRELAKSYANHYHTLIRQALYNETVGQIATALGAASEKQVRQWAHRGRKRLSTCIEDKLGLAEMGME